MSRLLPGYRPHNPAIVWELDDGSYAELDGDLYEMAVDGLRIDPLLIPAQEAGRDVREAARLLRRYREEGSSTPDALILQRLLAEAPVARA